MFLCFLCTDDSSGCLSFTAQHTLLLFSKTPSFPSLTKGQSNKMDQEVYNELGPLLVAAGMSHDDLLSSMEEIEGGGEGQNCEEINDTSDNNSLNGPGTFNLTRGSSVDIDIENIENILGDNMKNEGNNKVDRSQSKQKRKEKRKKPKILQFGEGIPKGSPTKLHWIKEPIFIGYRKVAKQQAATTDISPSFSIPTTVTAGLSLVDENDVRDEDTVHRSRLSIKSVNFSSDNENEEGENKESLSEGPRGLASLIDDSLTLEAQPAVNVDIDDAMSEEDSSIGLHEKEEKMGKMEGKREGTGEDKQEEEQVVRLAKSYSDDTVESPLKPNFTVDPTSLASNVSITYINPSISPPQASLRNTRTLLTGLGKGESRRNKKVAAWSVLYRNSSSGRSAENRHQLLSEMGTLHNTRHLHNRYVYIHVHIHAYAFMYIHISSQSKYLK